MNERLTQILKDTYTDIHTDGHEHADTCRHGHTHARRKRRGDIRAAWKPKETPLEHTGVGTGHASPLGGPGALLIVVEMRNATYRSAVQGQEMAQKRTQ